MGVPLLGQILAHGQRLLGSNTRHAERVSRNLFDTADFLPLRNRILKGCVGSDGSAGSRREARVAAPLPATERGPLRLAFGFVRFLNYPRTNMVSLPSAAVMTWLGKDIWYWVMFKRNLKMFKPGLPVQASGIALRLKQLVTMVLLTGLTWASSSMSVAVATPLLDEPFTGATLNSPSDWIASAGGTLTEWPCLTHATQATQVSAGTVEACVNQVSPAPEPANYASTLPAAAGEGSLRLTRRRAINNPNLVAGSLLYARELSASEGLDISFSIRMEDVNVADGMSFFLKDGANTDNAIGAAGGSLGYGMSHPISGATILDPPNGNGVPGAILGIGFDKWGNFSWNAVASSDCATRGTHTSQGSPPASAKNQLVLRGPDTSVGQDGSSGYCYLGAQAVSYSPSSFQRVRVVVPPYAPGTPTTVEVYLAPANDPTNLPVSPTLTQEVTLTAMSFKFGFSGSTGWYSNNHDLRGLLIEPAGQALWWPAVVSTSAVTGSGTGPTSGGTLLTITGTSFNAGATVTVGGNPCTDVTITGGSQLTCTAPPGSLGAKEVVVTNPNSTPGYGTFTYINPTPTVTAIMPSSGAAAGGNTVTITGTGFVDGATVSLGGSSCTSVSVLSSTSLSCVAPAGSVGAVVDVVVTNLGPVSGTGLNLYTYVAGVSPPLPVSVMNHPVWWVLMVVLMLLLLRRIPGTRQMLS